MAGKKILLVDDSEMVLMMHRMMLQDSGYELLTAKTGEEALEKASAQRPDLILMDVTLPGMSGQDACRALKEREGTRDTPVILITTKNVQQKMAELMKTACTDFLTKPVPKSELLAKVRQYLET